MATSKACKCMVVSSVVAAEKERRKHKAKADAIERRKTGKKRSAADSKKQEEVRKAMRLSARKKKALQRELT